MQKLALSLGAEFSTVDLLLNSDAETKGVDAFALSVIKTERQIRRLFTFLVYQQAIFHKTHVRQLRGALARRHRVYFEGLLRGFDALSPATVEDLVGDAHTHLRGRLREAHKHRNKIFHGQLTANGLSQVDLIGLVNDLRRWCGLLAESSNAAFGYDGFGRNSFRKSGIPGLADSLRIRFDTFEDYEKFLANHCE